MLSSMDDYPLHQIADVIRYAAMAAHVDQRAGELALHRRQQRELVAHVLRDVAAPAGRVLELAVDLVGAVADRAEPLLEAHQVRVDPRVVGRNVPRAGDAAAAEQS